MIQPNDWVCDLGCGPQALRWFLPRSAVYLPADLKRWTPDTEVCDLNTGIMPKRSLEVCDVCAMLGLVTYLDDPDALFRELALTVERVLLSHFDTTAAHENNFLWGRVTSLDDLCNILSVNGFRIVERVPYCTWILIRADNQKFDDGARRRRATARAAFRIPAWSLRDEWQRSIWRIRTCPWSHCCI